MIEYYDKQTFSGISRGLINLRAFNGEKRSIELRELEENYSHTNRKTSFLRNEYHIDYEKELTDLELEKLKDLNEELRKMEYEIQPEIERYIKGSKERMDNNEDWLQNVNGELEVVFYLSEKSPAYEEDAGNELVVLRDCLTDFIYKSTERWGIADGNNHTISFFPPKDTIHCYTYHALLDHTSLSFKEVAQIGSFDMQLIIKRDFTL